MICEWRLKVSEKDEFELVPKVELGRVREPLQDRLEDERQSGRRAEVIFSPVWGAYEESTRQF